jgi:hypothetical protein
MSTMGEDAGTAMTSYSPVSRAIAVAWETETGESFQSVAPSITRPVMSSDRAPAGPALTNCESPMVPAAPGTFCTSTIRARPSFSITCWSARAV